VQVQKQLFGDVLEVAVRVREQTRADGDHQNSLRKLDERNEPQLGAEPTRGRTTFSCGAGANSALDAKKRSVP
jgi:hypothetical protein